MNKYIEIFKNNFFKIMVISIIVIIAGLLGVTKVGIKDGGTFALSVLFLCIIFLLAKDNLKKAVYVFIISMPILVTARKMLYIDIGIFMLNFESVIILYLFFRSFTDFIKKIKHIMKKDFLKNIFSFMALFVIASYVSILFAKDPAKSFALTTTSVLIPMLLFFIFISIFNKDDIKSLVYSLVLSINLSCVYGAIQILGIGLDLSLIKSSRQYLTFGYHNVNIFVNIALLVYPLILHRLLYKKDSKFEKLFLVFSLLLQTGSIFLTFSRGAWLALAMIIGASFFSKKYKIIFVILFIIGLLLGKSVLPTILNRGGQSQNFLSITSNTARILSIKTSKEILDNNILGVGFGNFNENYRENVIQGYYEIPLADRKVMSVPLYTMENPHNLFLAVGVELGIVALIAIICIFIERIAKGLNNFSENRDVLISIGIFIFIGLTTGIELNHKGVITNMYIFWIILAFITLRVIDNKPIELQ